MSAYTEALVTVKCRHSPRAIFTLISRAKLFSSLFIYYRNIQSVSKLLSPTFPDESGAKSEERNGIFSTAQRRFTQLVFRGSIDTRQSDTLRSPYVQKLTNKFLNLSIKVKFVKFVENL